MKVKVNDYSATGRVMDLAAALTPDESEGGQIERLERLVQRQAEIIGRMAALMVEKEWLSLDKASDLCGNYGQIIEVYVEPDPEPPKRNIEVDSKWSLPGPLFNTITRKHAPCWGCGGNNCDGSCTESV